MATDGRALTLLQKVAAAEDYTCPHLHRAFLKQLKAMLPKDCKPVIVTDAGFKVPWLKQVRKLGWHYVARVRGNVKLKLAEQTKFMTVNALYKKARATPKHLGAIVLTQTQQYETRAILVGKGYKLLKRDKNKSYKEPWLLVSSLPECHDYPPAPSGNHEQGRVTTNREFFSNTLAFNVLMISPLISSQNTSALASGYW
jgi:hypothetical protein